MVLGGVMMIQSAPKTILFAKGMSDRDNYAAPKHAHQRGQSLIEFALLLPLLMMIMAAAIDLARVFDTYVSITNASREGARYGASFPDDADGIRDQVRRELTDSGIPEPDNITPTCSAYADGSSMSCSSVSSGDRITVTVSTSFRFITGLILGLGSVTLTAATTMAVTP